MIKSCRLILPLFVLSIMACEKTPEKEVAGNDLLIGSWFNPHYNDSIVIYERSNGLVDNDYGFTFNEDHTFVERKNAGWCATPPIYYSDFDGIWTMNDSILEITVGYWGGTAEYWWKILTIDEAILKIERVEEIYHLEE